MRMNEILKTAVRVSLIGFILSLVVWIFADNWRPVAAGFGAGTLISIVNGQLLRNKVLQLTRVAADNSGKRTGMGFGPRLALVLLGALMAFRFPEVLHLPAILVGSFIVQITMLPVALWHNLRGSS